MLLVIVTVYLVAPSLYTNYDVPCEFLRPMFELLLSAHAVTMAYYSRPATPFSALNT